MARVRIGDLLIRAGLIDELQLNAALSHQKQWSGKLGDILVERGFLDEMMLWMGLSKQLNVALVNITTNPIPADVVAVLGAAMCRQYEIFPIALHERTLTVATSDPNNLGALDEVAFRTGTKVKAVLAPAREIEWAIRRYYENDPSQCAPAKQRRTLHGEEMNILSQQQGLRPGAVSASANPIAMGAAQFESQNTYPQGPPTPQTAYPAIQPMGQIALNPSMHAAFPTAPARQAPTHAPQASPPPQPNSASAISQ